MITSIRYHITIISHSCWIHKTMDLLPPVEDCATFDSSSPPRSSARLGPAPPAPDLAALGPSSPVRCTARVGSALPVLGAARALARRWHCSGGGEIRWSNGIG